MHMVQLMPQQPHQQISVTFLVPAYPGCSGKYADKWVSLCQHIWLPTEPGFAGTVSDASRIQDLYKIAPECSV